MEKKYLMLEWMLTVHLKQYSFHATCYKMGVEKNKFIGE